MRCIPNIANVSALFFMRITLQPLETEEMGKKNEKKISEDTKRSNNKKRVHGNCMHIILLMNFPYTHCGPHIVNCVYSVCAALERKRKTIWRIVEAES